MKGAKHAMKAVIFAGGWSGHKPAEFAAWAQDLLTAQAFTVKIYDSFDPLTDPTTTQDVDLIVPIWSSAYSSHRPELGNLTNEQEAGLLGAIERGVGIAGWHGHMGDAFRDRPNYHFMLGGQFVGHPPGWPDNPIPQDDFIDYQVNIVKPDDPIVEGITDFWIHSEQYYMLVDPSNDVLATTTFSGEYLSWIEGSVIPVTWKRHWGQGRVFYCSIGHTLDDLKLPPVTTMIRRGMLWASKQKTWRA